MTLQTTSKPAIAAVTFLEDAQAEFVSLVPKGANWTPYFSVKNDKGDQTVPGQIIQSVIVPGSPEWAELIQRPEFAGLKDLMVAKVQRFNDCTQFVQVNKGDFSGGSLRTQALGGDTGALVVWGELEEGAGVTPRAKAMGDVVPAAAELQQQVIASMISSEMWRFQDLVWGALGQTAAVPAKRKVVVMNALDALWNFFDQVLDSVGGNTIKCDKNTADNAGTKPEGNVILPEDAKTIDKNAGGNDMTKDEVKAIFDELMVEKAKVAEAEKVAAEKQANAPAPGYVAEITKAISDVAAVVAELKTDLKTVTERVDAAKGADGEPETPVEPTVDAAAIETLKSDLVALKAKLDKALHSTGATAPASDTVAKQKMDDGKDWGNTGWN